MPGRPCTPVTRRPSFIEAASFKAMKPDMTTTLRLSKKKDLRSLALITARLPRTSRCPFQTPLQGKCWHANHADGHELD